MGIKDAGYQVVYRGQMLDRYFPGCWVFFQRPKECGGGYWLGRAYDDVFMIEYERPVSLNQGIAFLMNMSRVEETSNEVIDQNYSLF